MVRPARSPMTATTGCRRSLTRSPTTTSPRGARPAPRPPARPAAGWRSPRPAPRSATTAAAGSPPSPSPPSTPGAPRPRPHLHLQPERRRGSGSTYVQIGPGSSPTTPSRAPSCATARADRLRHPGPRHPRDRLRRARHHDLMGQRARPAVPVPHLRRGLQRERADRRRHGERGADQHCLRHRRQRHRHLRACTAGLLQRRLAGRRHPHRPGHGIPACR